MFSVDAIAPCALTKRETSREEKRVEKRVDLTPSRCFADSKKNRKFLCDCLPCQKKIIA